jgi:hypothetical protein
LLINRKGTNGAKAKWEKVKKARGKVRKRLKAEERKSG